MTWTDHQGHVMMFQSWIFTRHGYIRNALTGKCLTAGTNDWIPTEKQVKKNQVIFKMILPIEGLEVVVDQCSSLMASSDWAPQGSIDERQQWVVDGKLLRLKKERFKYWTCFEFERDKQGKKLDRCKDGRIVQKSFPLNLVLSADQVKMKNNKVWRNNIAGSQAILYIRRPERKDAGLEWNGIYQWPDGSFRINDTRGQAYTDNGIGPHNDYETFLRAGGGASLGKSWGLGKRFIQRNLLCSNNSGAWILININ